jgi:hypothetical protein
MCSQVSARTRPPKITPGRWRTGKAGFHFNRDTDKAPRPPKHPGRVVSASDFENANPEVGNSLHWGDWFAFCADTRTRADFLMLLLHIKSPLICICVHPRTRATFLLRLLHINGRLILRVQTNPFPARFHRFACTSKPALACGRGCWGPVLGGCAGATNKKPVALSEGLLATRPVSRVGQTDGAAPWLSRARRWTHVAFQYIDLIMGTFSATW